MKQHPPMVLVIDENPSSRRLLCETIVAFKQCEIESSGDTLLGYQKAITLPITLLLMSLTTPKIPATILYEILAQTYPRLRRSRPIPPPVIFLGNAGDAQANAQEFRNDPRVKGVLLRPLKLQSILDALNGVIPDREDNPLGGLNLPEWEQPV
jgi:CheY-like chemotaxis protein